MINLLVDRTKYSLDFKFELNVWFWAHKVTGTFKKWALGPSFTCSVLSFLLTLVVVFLQIMLSFHQSYKQYLKECVTVQTSCLAGNWRSAVYFVTGSLSFKSSFA